MSEYDANKYLAGLRQVEARISRECEPGYDPYNSADRFRWPVLVGIDLAEASDQLTAVGYFVHVEKTLEADRSKRASPKVTLLYVDRFAPDEFDEPPLGPGPPPEMVDLLWPIE